MHAVKSVLPPSRLSLSSRTWGGLPLVNHFLDRLGLQDLLNAYVPHTDRRLLVPPSRTLGVLLRNILLSRMPLYSLPAWAQSFEPSQLGLAPDESTGLNDDRIGRSLDRLFDADRASLLTEVVVRAVRECDVDWAEMHNDSTTVTFSGR